jgi:transposase
MPQTRRPVSGPLVEPLDFSDDRLAPLLRHLSKAKYWQPSEQALTERRIEVYELPVEVIGGDATTVLGYHEVANSGLMPFGHSKDDPTRPQFNLMTGSLDPLGMPLAVDVLSGERAADGL